MLRRPSWMWLTLATILLLVLAACGEDDGVAVDDDPAEPAEVDDEDEEEVEDAPAAWEPTRDVTVTVPFNPGGGADTSQRTWNEYAEPLLDVSLSVENREGAGGVTGWGQMINQGNPDGHHIAIATPPFNVLPKVMDPDAVPYEHEDFTYICIYGVVPGALFVPEGSEWQTLEEFLDTAREDPGAISVAVAGAAGAEALISYLLMNAADVEFTLVPFDGGAESVTATRGGTTDAMIGSTTYIPEQAGELRALAVARASDDDPEFPEVPSFRQEGYEVVQERYRALAGPPDIDPAAVAFWEDICLEVSENEDFRQAAADTGNPAPPEFIGSEEATRLVMEMVQDVELVAQEFGLQE